MKTASGLLLLSALLFAACQEGGTTAQEIREGASEAVNAPADYVGANVRAQQQASATTAKMSVDNAIRMFRAAEGRNPANLNELIQEGYLPAMPELPRGVSFQYDAQTGTASLKGY